MAYRVVKLFTDLQDHGYKYAEGDTYPREGYEPSAERIEMLSTANNRQRTVLIEAIPESPTEDWDDEWIAEQATDEEPVAEAVPEVIPETESDETVEESAVEETAEEKPKRKSRKK